MAREPVIEGAVSNVEHGWEPAGSSGQRGMEYYTFVVTERKDGTDQRMLEVEMRYRNIEGTVIDDSVVQVFGKIDANNRVIANRVINVQTNAVTRPTKGRLWLPMVVGIVLIIAVIIVFARFF
jgi:hypothetical protein